jgi:hypothetical protein
MSKLPLLVLGSIGLAVGLYACSSSSGDDDDGIIPYDGGPDVIYVPDTGADGPDPNAGMGKTFCDSTLGVIQNAVGQCCSVAEKSGLSTDLYKNIDTYLTSCETTLESSIAQHRTAPNTAQYTACINAYKAEFALPPAANACQGLDAYRVGDVLSISCPQAWQGVVAAGGPCAGDFDCATGLVCIGYGPGSDGKCSAQQPADGTCGPATSTTTPAVDFVLAPQDDCVSNFYCASGTCKPQLDTDGGCTSDPQCQQGACFDEHCTNANADGSRLPTGAYCVTSADCIEGDYCHPEATPKADGGALPETTGACAPSLGGPDGGSPSCDPSNAHECQGACVGTTCGQLCTWH